MVGAHQSSPGVEDRSILLGLAGSFHRDSRVGVRVEAVMESSRCVPSSKTGAWMGQPQSA